MSEAKKLPEIAHLRGLGEPLFFTFNLDPKSNILISHAVIFATFILPTDRKLDLAQEKDDPRFVHFLKYLSSNKILDPAEMIKALEGNIAKEEAELKVLNEKIGQLKSQTT